MSMPARRRCERLIRGRCAVAAWLGAHTRDTIDRLVLTAPCG